VGQSDEIRVFTGRGRSALDVVHRVTGSLIELLKLGQDSGSEFDVVVADRTLIDPHAAAALRLLILTGARLREILNLR